MLFSIRDAGSQGRCDNRHWLPINFGSQNTGRDVVRQCREKSKSSVPFEAD